jgi:protein-S-isoprenylcysteine O-methyltransferase Ste14
MIFVAALATGTWRFVTLGTAPDEGPLIAGLLINTLLFGVFALHHSVLAREAVKTRVARLVSPPLERPTYVWVASLLFIAACLAWRPIAGTLYTVAPPWAWAIGALQLTGGILTLDAARRIDVRVLAGLIPDPAPTGPAPGSQPAMHAAPERTAGGADTDLVAAGTYRLVRHPIYLGWVLLVWATPDMTTGRFVFALISTAYLVVAVPFEERSLRRRFGPSYDTYRSTVRWRIVPWLY